MFHLVWQKCSTASDIQHHLVHSDSILSTSTCIFVSAAMTILDCFLTNLQASILDFDATIFATRWCFCSVVFFRVIERRQIDVRILFLGDDIRVFAIFKCFCDFWVFLTFSKQNDSHSTCGVQILGVECETIPSHTHISWYLSTY